MNDRLIVVLLFFLSAAVQAADEVVVTPVRYAQSTSQTVPSVIVIDRETIERTAAVDVADLLREYAGIDIGRTGGAGQQTSAFIRGANSNHTAVLINGVKMNSSTTGTPALEMIDTSAIERIEVVKGPRSTVYGSAALGGVINIITTDDKAENTAQMRVLSGKDSTTERGIEVSFANRHVHADFSFNRMDSDGFPATRTSETNHAHTKDTVDLNVKTELGKVGVKLAYWRAEGNTEYDGFGVDRDQDLKNEVLNTNFSLSVSENWESNLSISKVKDEIHQNQINFLGDKDSALTDRTTFDWGNIVSMFDHTLSFGMSIIDEDAEALSYGTSYAENTDEFSLYLNQESGVGKHRFFGSTRYVDHDDFGDEVLWNAEYTYQLFRHMRLFASIGAGFSAPNGNARFGYGSNPDLREETSRSIELGAYYYFNVDTDVSIRVYENKIEDLIETVLIDPETFTFENRNINEARIQGLELALHHRSKKWHINLEGSLKNPVNETEDSLLLRRAKRSLHGLMAYQHDRYFLQVNGLLTSKRTDVGDTELSGYGLLNASAGMRFPYATVALKINNLLDKDYKLASGYNVAGQSAFAELRIDLAQ